MSNNYSGVKVTSISPVNDTVKGTGFSLNQYREANRLTLYKSSETTETNKVFSAYCDGKVNFNLGLKFGNYLGTIDNAVSGTGPMSAIAAYLSKTVLGTSSAINLPMKPFFAGMKEMRWNFKCFLPLKDNYDTDIEKEVNELLKFCLPRKNESLNQGVTKAEEVATALENKVASFWETAARAIGEARDIFIKSVTFLEIPEQIQNTNAQACIVIGSKIITNVIIDSINLKYAPHTYVDEKGQVYPSHLIVELGVIGVHKPTLDGFVSTEPKQP